MIALSRGTILQTKNADISKFKGVFVLKDIFSETTYVCVLIFQISSFMHNLNKFWTGGNFTPPPPPSFHTHTHAQTANEPLKDSPRSALNFRFSLKQLKS